MRRLNINPLVLMLALAGIVYAGMTNMDALTLSGVLDSGTTVLSIENGSGSEVASINTDGDAVVVDLTASGAIALSGAQTITADMTFSGAGIDILANADNQNDIGTESASFAEGYFKVLDADTSITSDGTLAVTGISTLTGRIDAAANIQLDSGGTGSATQGCVGLAGVAGDGTVSLCADNNSGQWDGFQLRGPANPATAGSVDIAYGTTATVTVVAALESAGLALDNTTDLTCDTDGGCDVGASGTEFGTAWVQTIDDGDGTVTVAAALESGGLALDDTTDLTCDADGGCDVGASGTEFGTAWVQTIDDGDGTVTVAANLDTSAGTVALGSNVPTMTTSSYFWIFAAGITCADSNGCSEGEQGGKETRIFADSTTDDTANIWVPLPPDFAEGTSGLHISVLYNMPSGSPTEGEWDVTYLAVADDDADAALGGEVTVLDTPAAADDWNLTSAMVIPAAAITSSDLGVAISLYHDVTDPFGGDVEVAGIKVGYTTDKNY